MRYLLSILLLADSLTWAHDAHGRSTAPPEARRLKSPIPATPENVVAGQPYYERLCAACHGADGKARTAMAGKLAVRPTDLSNYLMESMRDGEIYWVITNGIDKNMPAFTAQTDETQRWQLVQYVRELRQRQHAVEKAKLGPYD